MRNLFTLGTLFLLNTSMVFCQAPQTFSWQGDLFQYYTVPTTGYYFMQARGGQGGPVDTYSGGKGAHVQGYFFLEAGDFLIIAAAGQGARGELAKQDQGNNFWFGAGGGGASSVVKQIKPNWYTYEYTPLLIAGGGGGAYGGDSCAQCSSPAAEGIGGSTSPYGIATGGPGGINGSGGGIGISEAGGAGGAGYSGNGGTHCIGACKPDFSDAFAVGGQAYINGNYGGGFQAYLSYGFGGWGGGGQGGFDATSAPGYTSGGGGGGGGYSGGSGGEANTGNISAGGGGGSLNTSICGQSDSSGVNEGNGFVTISGPNITTEVVNSLVNPYIWPANGVSYTASGSYVFTDSANCVTRILDLHFGLNSCTSYTRIDTTIISCGSYTNPLNGRTYTENTTDSIRVGCTKYVVRLFITAPELLMGNMITGSSAVSGLTNVGNNASSIPLSVCKNSTEIYSINPVPYATSYQWTLPSGLTGTSTTSSITVQISNSFSGGDICVTPVNACGSGATMCRAITVLNTPPTGHLQITGPSSPFISGNYSVNPIAGATAYTWNVSNNEAVILSGQGTPSIQLQAQQGFKHTNLSVVASNCRGNGSRGTVSLKAKGNALGAAAAPARFASYETEGISVYPNPTSGQFTLNTLPLATDAKLEIYSADGRLVYKQSIPANTTQTSINLQQPAAGLYQVRMVAGDEIIRVKVVVNQ